MNYEYDGLMDTDLFMAAVNADIERQAKGAPDPVTIEGVPIEALMDEEEMDRRCPGDGQAMDRTGWARKFPEFPREIIQLLEILENRTCRDQALPAADLAVMLGLADASATRATRAAQTRGLISTWMGRGLPFPILACDRGHFRGVDPEDVRAYADRLVNQASETLVRLHGLVQQCQASALRDEVPSLVAVERTVGHARTLKSGRSDR